MITHERCLNVLIANRDDTAEGIISLELVSPDGGNLPPFEAGSHVDVHIAPGLIRQYSLCNDPSESRRYRLGILRDEASRGGSVEIHRTFVPGQVIRISEPRCNFHLATATDRAVLLAGGIGITPLLSMAYRLHALDVPFTMHYCTRSSRRTAFAAEIASSAFAPQVDFHYDEGAPAQRFSLDTCLPDVRKGTHLYACGPEGFIRFVTDGAISRGWEPEQIHSEHFKAEISTNGSTFTVVAAVSGVSVTVPTGVTVAQALMNAGVSVPLSCEQGVCGTCLTHVIEGVPDHRDQYQTDDEKRTNTQMTPCCSRSLSEKIVLEI
ncbi:Vanillate O-demethylase oxidoreductase [Burkholderia ubonensis]|uniref:Vanillate O-demethylase oxidoreductase n=2 Tax=Burkholderia cepacia complex TaxID=87882 RepID=A0A1B4PZB7_BURCE|nr:MULTISPECIES: PDR/VanB family oxidoreductase [Burkholderia cepacia complex]AOK19250.1 Vanillate O-demethylase oxidoreductase [Burkholderia cepacia]AOK26008.1 Vanillate O-demethylase oxidoreductase [Burkholderia ubonensis]KWC49819.1 Vanillate O-demethylase oxidoreductase [Burkholderia ubonensis]